MLRRALLVPALVGLARSQPVASSDTYAPVAAPDALPIDDLRNVDVPTYTETPGLASAIVSYATETAIAAVQADVTQDPLSQFVSASDLLKSKEADRQHIARCDRCPDQFSWRRLLEQQQARPGRSRCL